MNINFYDILRPLYLPIIKRLRRRLGRCYFEHPEMELPAAYDSIQMEVERRLHRYLHCDRRQIARVALVGANTGQEISRLKEHYPNAHFTCFEPSILYLTELHRQWDTSPYVEVHGVALGAKAGKAAFHEMSIPGNGSLLPPDINCWSAANECKDRNLKIIEVATRKLDEYFGNSGLDLLWVDVQGAEMDVLKGGIQSLKKTMAVFLEVTLSGQQYHGAARLFEIDEFLTKEGFNCCGLGIDPWNFTGNALWVKGISDLICKEHRDRK